MTTMTQSFGWHLKRRKTSPKKSGKQDFQLAEEERRPSEARVTTPERPPPTVRKIDEENRDDTRRSAKKAKPDNVEDEAIKEAMRYFRSGKPLPQRDIGSLCNFEGLDLDPDDRRIISACMLGVGVMDFHRLALRRCATSLVSYAGISLDLTTGWDFSKPADQAEVWRRVKEDQPRIIVGSPPCTFFTTPQENQPCQECAQAGMV